jgi:hypothetical protein
MVTISVFWLCIGGLVIMWIGALFGWLILGLCNAAAEGERKAEELQKLARDAGDES